MNEWAPAETDNRVVELREGGVQYRLFLPNVDKDYISKRIIEASRPYEAAMLEDMAARLEPGDHVIDVGANIGNHTVYLAAVAGCRVTAFEPNVELAHVLRRNVRLNDLEDRVRISELGLGRAASGAAFAQVRPENTGGQRLCLDNDPAAEIQIAALDSLTEVEEARILKIDVEGMELDVIEGAAGFIDRVRPVIYAEALDEEHFLGMDRRLRNLGYVFWDTFNKDATHLFLHACEVDADARFERIHKLISRTQYHRQAAMEGVLPRLHDVVKRSDFAWACFHEATKKAERARDALAAAEARAANQEAQLDVQAAALLARTEELVTARAEIAADARNADVARALVRRLKVKPRRIAAAAERAKRDLGDDKRARLALDAIVNDIDPQALA